MVYGEYPLDDGPNAPRFLPSGVIRNRDLSHIEKLDPAKITEQVKHSWYDYEGGDDVALHPSVGETKPTYTGPKPPYERLDTDREVFAGSSRRATTACRWRSVRSRACSSRTRRGTPQVKALVDGALAKLGVGPEALFSTLGRVAARGIETAVLADKMGDWVDELADNMGRGRAPHPRQRQVGSVELAREGGGRRLPRGAARRRSATGSHIENGSDRALPVHRAEHVERGTARRA